MSDNGDWVTIVAPEIIDHNETTQIRVEIKESPEGKKGLQIRYWFRGTAEKTGPDKLKIGPWRPTKKGIWIPIERMMQVHAALVVVVRNYNAKMQERL